MSEVVKFGQKFEKKKRKEFGKILYTPRKEGDSIVIRFVGNQFLIYQEWDMSNKSFNCYKNKKEGTIPRIVSFVIDRSDGNIKGFICSKHVFSQLGNSLEPTECKATHDWQITRRGKGLTTRYEVNSLGETFVDDEILKKIAITSQEYPISDIFVNRMSWEILSEVPERINSRFDLLDF